MHLQTCTYRRVWAAWGRAGRRRSCRWWRPSHAPGSPDGRTKLVKIFRCGVIGAAFALLWPIRHLEIGLVSVGDSRIRHIYYIFYILYGTIFGFPSRNSIFRRKFGPNLSKIAGDHCSSNLWDVEPTVLQKLAGQLDDVLLPDRQPGRRNSRRRRLRRRRNGRRHFVLGVLSSSCDFLSLLNFCHGAGTLPTRFYL